MTGAEVVAAARAWVGVPFRHQGRGRDGLDCAGLVIRLANDLGLSDFDATGYARQPDGVTLQRICDEQMVRISEVQAADGDVALLAYDGGPQHLVVLARRGSVLYAIHANERAGRVVEHRLDSVWRARIVGWYRLPGV